MTVTALEEFWTHALHCPTCEPFPTALTPEFRLCDRGRRLFFCIPFSERPEADIADKTS